MKRLILKQLIIISQRDQEARIINFEDKLNIITGDNPEGNTINRTGKSLVMKSIYHSLGASLTKYTSNWKDLKISTIVTFLYDDIEYELYRDFDRFVLKIGDSIQKFDSVSDLRNFYVELFDFKLKMPRIANASTVMYMYPGAIFMPFYIDQDEGWSGTWDSFKDILSGKWKPEILLYHMGIKTSRYYELLDTKVSKELERTELKRQENTLSSVISNHVAKYESYMDISIDIDSFKSDIRELTDELNAQLDNRNQIKEELLKCFSDLREIEELYVIAQKNYDELLADIDYIDSTLLDDKIICPICGTEHSNDIQNKFSIYNEIEECEQTMQSYFAERKKIESRVELQTERLNELEANITNVRNILERKRNDISFNDIIRAQGSKSILQDMRQDLVDLRSHLSGIERYLKEISNELRAITRDGKDINDVYLRKLKANLFSLDVTDIDSKHLEKFSATFKSGGNDLPCAILAQVYAIYETANAYSRTVLPPLVLDAIFQQEPAKDKIQVIWDFLIKNQPRNSQLIVSTTEMHGYQVDGNIITLTEERRLLNQQNYVDVKDALQFYRSILMDKNA